MTNKAISGRFRLDVLLRAFATGALFLTGIAGTAQAAGCGTTVRAGQQELIIQSGGLERSAIIFVPANYTGKKKVAVVFDLHGSNSYPKDQLSRSRWDDVAKREGFLVVAPQGGLDGKLAGTHAWNVPGVTAGNGPDDAGFLKDAVETVKAKFCVDAERIYASGYSGGGRMLSQYICNGNGDFAAAGFVMSLRAGYPRQKDGVWLPDNTSCAPPKPVSIIAFWGLKDNTNPFAGGGSPYWQYSGETALKRWAELDGCEGEMKVATGERISYMSFDKCKGGARILSYTIADGSHAWPGKTVGFSLASAADKVSEEVDAATRMWNFFDDSQGKLIADVRAKSDCPDDAIAATSKAGVKGTTCSQPGKPDSNEHMAADAL